MHASYCSGMSNRIPLLALLAGVGALGTLVRYGVYQFFERRDQVELAGIPLGTLAVNIIGSALFGVIIVFADEHKRLSPEMKLILLTGFMGAFTTFSTFAFESGRLIDKGQWGPAMLNIAAQNILGIGALLLAMNLSRRLFA